MNRRDVGEALLCGLAGASALKTVHQVLHRVTPVAPRMDEVALRAVAAGFEAGGGEPPPRQRLYPVTVAGGLLADGAYYSLVALGRKPNIWVRGALLGLAGGIAALWLPRRIGLGDPPHSDSTLNQALTVAVYLAGGMAAAATAACLDETRHRAIAA